MQVKDVMSTAIVDVQPETSIYCAIQTMLTQKVSGVPVINREGAIVGVLTEGDLLRRVELGTVKAEHWYSSFFKPGGNAEAYVAANTRRVGDVMTRNPITIAPDATLAEAVGLMEGHNVKRLMVVDGDQLVGVISRSDFLRALAPILAPAYEEPAVSDEEIRLAIASELARQPWAASTGIRVEVKEGRVALYGPIVSESQRTAARVLAENIDGVHSVADYLTCQEPIAFGV